jgi:hypothetical protein
MEWQQTIERNLDHVSERVTGQPHERNLDRWRQLSTAATCRACIAC